MPSGDFYDACFCPAGAAITFTADFGKPVMAFHVDDQMPVAAFGNGEPDGRFFGNSADILEIENLGKALIVRRRHQPHIVHRIQCHLDNGSGALLVKIIMGKAEVRFRHRSLRIKCLLPLMLGDAG